MLRWLLALWFSLASAVHPALAALTINNLSGFNVAAQGEGAPVPVITRRIYGDFGAGTSTVTSVPVNIGAADASRVVVAMLAGELSGDLVSMTVDVGSGATAMNATTLASFNSMRARIFYLAAPTGTTATFVATYGGTPSGNQASVAFYTVTGIDPTPTTSGVDTSDDMDSTDPLTTGSVTIPDGGAFLAVASASFDTVAKTWTNATEDEDDDAGTFRFLSATSVSPGTTTVTVQGTSNGEDGALAYVVFGPE